MKIKKIILNNIRSYQHEEIEFPEGSILLSGDIGSGKTSILLGIEFALFGLQPGQKGNSLLKNGADEGGVKLEFEIEEKQIIVERTLRRKKTISQDYCAITINGEKSEYSVTELKDKVLELLNYPREFSRKQNLLYKFTVYTPQEEMKQIIIQDSETRINTLRQIFGIDKYKKISENTAILTAKLREEKRFNESLIENFESDREFLEAKEDELESKQHNIISVEKELFLKIQERKKIQDEIGEISDKIDERNKFKQEIEKTRIMSINKKDSVLENEKILKKIQIQIEEMQNLDFDESKISLYEEQIFQLKEEKKECDNEKIRIFSYITSLQNKISDSEISKKNLEKIEICPTCLQDVDPVYKSNALNNLDSIISESVNQLKNLNVERENISKKSFEIESQISLKQKELQNLQIKKIQLKEFEEKRKRISELEISNVSLKKDIDMLENQIEKLNESVFALKKFENIYEDKERQLTSAFKEERLAEIKVAELKKEIEVFTRQIEELKNKIKKLEDIKEKLNYLIKLETWLSKNFSELVLMIEKNVMIKLKSEFSEFFSLWFSMLVSDTFEVRLDDDFTPLIEHQDYELDYDYMSGGERTAVALAYRLALNQVVNSLLSKIKTRDIVILDEPTDGFSEQQLDKMRDVLNQLNVNQLIIVSHEQKIEGFVENVIRFEKEHGVSKKISEKLI